MTLSQIHQDVSHAVRGWRGQPGFVAAAWLALAIGIGGCGLIFSIADAVLFHPLALPAPERLVLVTDQNLARGLSHMPASPGDFVDLRSEAPALSHLSAFHQSPITLDGEPPERLDGVRVSGELFTALGARPELGRAFHAPPGKPPERLEAVLSHGLWQRRFGGSASALGRTIRLDGEPHTVVGVMPADFQFLSPADVWCPLVLSAADWQDRQAHYIRLAARLAPDASLARAQRELDLLSARLARRFPAADGGTQAVAESLEVVVTAPLRPAVLLLLAASGLLLVAVCGNVANLMLARSAGRGVEVATRSALGAGAGRLVAQLLTESLVVTLAGGALGLAAAWAADPVLVRFTPQLAPRWREIGMDWRVALFTFALALATGLLAGLAPALRLVRPTLRSRLLAGGGAGGGLPGASLGWRRNRLAGLLATAQLAISFVLLVGAGLLARSFDRLMHVDPGFDPGHVLTVSLDLPRDDYPEGRQRAAFFTRLLERLKATPGIQEAGAIGNLPFAGRTDYVAVQVPGRTEREAVPGTPVTPDTFNTLRIPLLAGRQFADWEARDDGVSRPPVVVVSAALAHHAFPGEDPIGRQLLVGTSGGRGPRGEPTGRPATIIGVAGDVHATDLAADAVPCLYSPYAQAPSQAMTLCLRTSGDPAAMAGAVRRVIAQTDRRLPAGTIATLDQVMRDSASDHRLALAVVAAFAAVSLALAGVGVFGVLSNLAGRSTREIGVRMALGAEPRDILRLINRRALSIVVWGLLLGTVAARSAGHLLTSQLFGVTAADPLTYLTAGALLAALALLACLAPARRASRVDPAASLRRE